MLIRKYIEIKKRMQQLGMLAVVKDMEMTVENELTREAIAEISRAEDRPEVKVSYGKTGQWEQMRKEDSNNEYDQISTPMSLVKQRDFRFRK